MSTELDLLVIAPAEDPAGTKTVRVQPRAAVDTSAATAAQHSGLVIQTFRDAWAYCKASKRAAAGNRWLTSLSVVAVVLSAIAGTAVFTTLQDNPSAYARVAVGLVALFTAVVTAVQTWVATRIKALNDQAHQFHQLHREILSVLETGGDLKDERYTEKCEEALQKITAGMIEPSSRAWDKATEQVDKEMSLICPQLLSTVGRSRAAASTDNGSR